MNKSENNKPLNSKIAGKHVWNNLNFFKTSTGFLKDSNVKDYKFESDICNPDDIGDYLPGILWWGLNKKDVKHWVESYIQYWKSDYSTNIGLFGFIDSNGNLLKKQSFIDNCDTLYGLISLYILTNNNYYLKYAEEIVNSLAKYSISKKGFVYNFVSKNGGKFNFERGYFSHLPVVSSYYSECCSKLYEITNNRKYLDLARTLLYAWANTKTFKKYGLCVDRLYPGGRFIRANNATITKANTYFGLACLAYGKLTGDFTLLKKLLSSIESNFLKHNGQYGKIWSFDKKRLIDNRSQLTFTKSIIDLYLDSSIILKDKGYYNKALKLINSINFDKNSLLPEEKGGDVFVLDSQSDILTLYCKFYSLSKDNIWGEKAKKLLIGINNFYFNGFYVSYIKKNKPLNIFALKYQGLLLKSVLTYERVFLHHKKFYSNDQILDWVSVDR